MTDNPRKIFLDTSFFIRLYKTDDPDHDNAKKYYRKFRDNGDKLYLSTIVAAEFGTGADIKKLPYRSLTVLPFNLSHASRSSILASLAFEKKKKGVVQVGSRVVIPNDTKLLAQAEEIEADLFIARDKNCKTVFDLMKDNGLVSFDYLDLRTPPSTFFNELDFPGL